MLTVKLLYIGNWIVFIGLITNFLFLSCTHQKQKEFIPEVNTSPNQNPMIEKFDYESYKNKTLIGSMLPNGNKVTMASLEEDDNRGFLCDRTEIPPAPHYYQRIYKTYYPNLNLKSKETFFGFSNILIGTSEYYDENGFLIKKVDEDRNFENIKITPEKFIELLIEYKLLDKETGEVIPPYLLDLGFINSLESNDGKNYWGITICGNFGMPDRSITGLAFDAQDGLIVNFKPEELPKDLHYLKKYTKK